mgnify:CR=1 FL=1
MFFLFVFVDFQLFFGCSVEIRNMYSGPIRAGVFWATDHAYKSWCIMYSHLLD